MDMGGDVLSVSSHHKEGDMQIPGPFVGHSKFIHNSCGKLTVEIHGCRSVQIPISVHC
jgi:hypothetical protein